MEIQKQAINQIQLRHSKGEVKLYKGSSVRVRIVHEKKGYALVEINGRLYKAYIKHHHQSTLFIAKILRLSPKIILKFQQNLGGSHSQTSSKLYIKLQQLKKSFIQKLIDSDNFPVSRIQVTDHSGNSRERKALVNEIKHSIEGWNRLFEPKASGYNQRLVTQYLCFQNLSNLYLPDTFSMLLPLRVRQRNYLCDLKVTKKDNENEHSIFLVIYLNDSSKILFFVFVDFDSIQCTMASNSNKNEASMKRSLNTLIRGLRTLSLNRKVTVQITSYEQLITMQNNAMKSIDIRM